MIRISFLFVMMAGICTAPSPAYAGKLGDFERSATEEDGAADTHSPSQSGREKDRSSSCIDPIVLDVGEVIVSEAVAPEASSCIGGSSVPCGTAEGTA